MPSPQFQKLLDSLGQSSANTEASRDEIVAAYRQQISDCLVIDGVAPSIAKTTKAEKVLAGEVPSEWARSTVVFRFATIRPSTIRAANLEIRFPHLP